MNEILLRKHGIGFVHGRRLQSGWEEVRELCPKLSDAKVRFRAGVAHL